MLAFLAITLRGAERIRMRSDRPRPTAQVRSLESPQSGVFNTPLKVAVVANATLRTRHCDVGEGQGLTTPKEPQTPRPPRPTGLVDALSLGRFP